MDWLNKNKGYLIHYAAVGIIFLAPSVAAYLGAHHATTGGLALAWGTLLHWANGK